MKEMSKIVRTITNTLVPFILIFGFYIVLHGHLTPGGGFQGGAVIGSTIALVIVAHGSKKAITLFNKGNLSSGEVAALLGFIGLAFAGISTAFFYNFLAGGDYFDWLLGSGLFGNTVEKGINPGNLNTGGTVPLMNIVVGIEVVCAFGVILLSLLTGLEHAEPSDTESEGDEQL